MFALTSGELAIVLFIFALVWGAGVLPRLGERLAGWLADRSRGGGAPPPGGERPLRSPQDGG